MANKPFDYRIINPLERPTSEDLNIAQSQLSDTVRLFARELFENQAGFLGFGFYPYSTSAANAFSLSSGMMFANIGDPVYNIGGIAGVNDPLVYRVQTTDERAIDATSAPTTTGMKRWDLLQVRFLTGDERLTDAQSTGIFNPALKSFAAQQKYKTLTFDVTTQIPEQIPVGTPGLAVFSYISGNEAATWEAAVKPTATAAYYYPIAYIKRYQGQTAIEAADIEDARTLLTIPAGVGGIGASSVGDSGAIAYSNGTNLEFIRATLFGVPQTGRILVSGGASAPTWLGSASASSLLVSGGFTANPTWIAPGTEGQVLVSNGTSWAAGTTSRIQTHDFNTTKFTTTSYQEVASFTANAIAGAARIGVQLQENNDASDLWAWNQDIDNDGYVWLKFEVRKVDSFILNYYLVKYTVHGPSGGVGFIQSLASPSVSLPVESGNYEIKLYVKSPPTSATNIQVAFLDCALFFAQG